MDKVINIIVNVVIVVLVGFLIYRYVRKVILAWRKKQAEQAKVTRTWKYETTERANESQILPQAAKPVFTFRNQSRSQETIKPEQNPIKKIREEEIDEWAEDQNIAGEIKTRVQRIKQILNLFPGTYMIPIIWAVSLAFLGLLRFVIIGPSMHSIGPEYLEIGFLGLCMGVLVLELIFIIALLEFPGIWQHMKAGGFKKDFTELKPFERWVILLASLYFIAYVFLGSMQLI